MTCLEYSTGRLHATCPFSSSQQPLPYPLLPPFFLPRPQAEIDPATVEAREVLLQAMLTGKAVRTRAIVLVGQQHLVADASLAIAVPLLGEPVPGRPMLAWLSVEPSVSKSGRSVNVSLVA